MKLRLALLCLLTVFMGFTAVYATDPVLKGNFSGHITDAKTKLPLADASIYFSELKVGCNSDATGYFVCKNLPEGKHLVEVSHVGYATVTEVIDISSTSAKDFALLESIAENNAVIVTGVGVATQIKKAPFQVTLLKREELQQSAATNIIDALTRRPGISALSTGPAISKPVIRGLGYNRVLTINDGVRQEGQQWGDEHGIEIDEASVNKVEILKGPASLIYGSDALAGVINIITNVPVENNTVKGNILSNYQTNNRLRSFNANIAGNNNGFNWNLYGTSVRAADYSNKYDGKVFNSNYNQQNIGGYVGYNGAWGYSHLLVSNFNLKAGLVEGERDAQGYFIKPIAGGAEVRATEADFNSTTPGIPYQHIRHFKVATDNSIKLGKQKLNINVGFQRNQREEFGNPDDLEERALYFDLKTITYTAQLHLAEMNGWKTSVGINGMQQNNSNKGVEQLIPDYSLFDIGGYVYTQKTIKKLTLSGGVRYDNRHLDAKALLEGGLQKGAPFTKNFGNASGSVGAAVQLNQQINLKLNVARGFRAPSIPELASNGAHEGTIRYEYGNVALKSETSTQLDGGVDYITEHVTFGLAAYYNNFNNYIYYRKLEAAGGGDSTINIDGSNLTAFQFDQAKAAISGVELNVDIHPHPLDWLHIQNSFSMVRGNFAKAIEGVRSIPFIPAARLLTELRGNFKKIDDNVRNLYVKLEIDRTFAQDNVFTVYNTETISKGYTLLNAGIGTDFTNKKGATLFTLNLVANNLGDVAYQNHLSRLKYAAVNEATGRQGVFNMGRNFSIRLNIPFNFKTTAN